MMQLLPLPITVLVTDRNVLGDINLMINAVDAAVEGGIGLVQLRERDLPVDALHDLGRKLRSITRNRALLFVSVINFPQLEIAKAIGADGVQLPEKTLNIRDIRQTLDGSLRFIGSSVHSIKGSQQAEASGADFLILGTMFPSLTHPGVHIGGPSLMEAVGSSADVPVIGIGGITANNAGAVIRAGAKGVAVIREVLGATDPLRAAQHLSKVTVEAHKKKI